jgi:hypothetical protein
MGFNSSASNLTATESHRQVGNPLEGNHDWSSWMGSFTTPRLTSGSLDVLLTENTPDNATPNRTSTFDHAAGAQHQRRLATAYEMLRRYTTADQPSRPSSPKSVQTHQRYLQELGHQSPVACDNVIVNIFIGLFCVHVGPTLPCFKHYNVDSSTPEEVSLMMAAIGGLYCRAPRSTAIARWLFHTAQRKMNTLVSRRRTLGPCLLVIFLRT